MTKMLKAYKDFLKKHAWARVVSFVTLAGTLVSIVVGIQTYRNNEQSLEPLFKLICTTSQNDAQVLPKMIYFASESQFVPSHEAQLQLQDKRLYKVGKTYVSCFVQNLAHAAYNIVIPVEILFSRADNTETDFKTERIVNVDPLGTDDKFDFAIADLSEHYYMHVRFATEARAVVHESGKSRDYMIVRGDATDDVEKYSFDPAGVADLETPLPSISVEPSPSATPLRGDKRLTSQTSIYIQNNGSDELSEKATSELARALAGERFNVVTQAEDSDLTIVVNATPQTDPEHGAFSTVVFVTAGWGTGGTLLQKRYSETAEGMYSHAEDDALAKTIKDVVNDVARLRGTQN
jgi:hypothetical protein